MITFDWSDFTALLSPFAIAMSVVLGVIAGTFSRTTFPARIRRLYWMVWNGIVFFVPLSVLRALEESPVWERLLATLVLWVLFAIGVLWGSGRGQPKDGAE